MTAGTNTYSISGQGGVAATDLTSLIRSETDEKMTLTVTARYIGGGEIAMPPISISLWKDPVVDMTLPDATLALTYDESHDIPVSIDIPADCPWTHTITMTANHAGITVNHQNGNSFTFTKDSPSAIFTINPNTATEDPLTISGVSQDATSQNNIIASTGILIKNCIWFLLTSTDGHNSFIGIHCDHTWGGDPEPPVWTKHPDIPDGTITTNYFPDGGGVFVWHLYGQTDYAQFVNKGEIMAIHTGPDLMPAVANVLYSECDGSTNSVNGTPVDFVWDYPPPEVIPCQQSHNYHPMNVSWTCQNPLVIFAGDPESKNAIVVAPSDTMPGEYTVNVVDQDQNPNWSGSAQINVYFTVDLDADINRDGLINANDADDPEENTSPGMIIGVNDNDSGLPTGPDCANDQIDSSADIADMGLITARKLPTSRLYDTAELSVSDKSRVRIFDENGTAIIGPLPGADTATYTIPLEQLKTRDINFRVEGIAPRQITATLTYKNPDGITIASDSIKITILSVELVPDFNHDKKITGRDKTLIASSSPFHFWVNDDADDGNEADGDCDMPGQSGGLFGDANYYNNHVDGRCDLLDFFPLWLDLHDALEVLSTNDGAEYKLRQANGAVKAVYTDLTKGTAGNFLDTAGSTYGPSFNQKSYEASTFKITSSGVTLSTDFLNKIKNDARKGILLMEGAASSTSPLVLEIWKNGSKICEKEMAMQISGVEDMYRMINLRPSGCPSTSMGEPANNPDSLSNGKNLFFLHGFNVNADQSRLWNAEIFKRLYQSGSRAKFWGMAWEGDIGLINALHYQDSAANALTVSSNFSAHVAVISGTKIVLAHSLGNLVVSSAIQDHGLRVSKYFMLDAAVATECYDPTTFNDSTTGNYMLHTAWFGYDSDTWCSKWFEIFPASDDRKKLTWKDRFPAVVPVAYNFYSTGDEVLEIYQGTPSAFSGGLFHLERYAWQKQEMFKGCGGLGGTSWAGWGFAGKWDYDPAIDDAKWEPEYTMNEANAASSETLRVDAVFRHDPSSMFSSNISFQVINNILAKGIPALSCAAAVSPIVGAQLNYDANVNKPNGWGRNDNSYGTRWLHSDLKNMAYFYTHDMFDQIVLYGGLR